LKRAIPVLLFAIVLLVCMAVWGCGGSSNSGGKPSSVAKRAFVSNDQDGLLHIINAQLDTESGFFVNLGGRPHEMYLSADHKFTLVHAQSTNTLFLVDNTKEQPSGNIRLPDVTESFVLLPDNLTAFAAVRNTGVVDVLNFSNSTISSSIPVPLARYLALNHAGTRLLAFGDGQDTVTVIDTAAKTASAPIPGFSRPVGAVFSADDTTAYVMNCGPECLGTAADPSGNTSVTVLNMSASPPAIVKNIIVPAATVGLLSGSTLYVAGSPPGATCGSGTTAPTCGRLSIIDTGSQSVTSSGVVITDGFHNHMELGSNNLLFIGARTCTVVTAENRGCLSLYDASANTASIPHDVVSGDVTGIAPIANRNTVYVVEAGELRVWDTTGGGTLAPAGRQIDIIGLAWDVKDID
jgi:DNA-binding beta-propeller fold protein YncE